MSGVLGRFISYMRNRIFRKYYFIKLFVFTILEAAITFSPLMLVSLGAQVRERPQV